MARTERRIPVIASIALAGLIAAGANVAVADKNSLGSGPVRCEIKDRVQGNTIFLEPVIHSDRSVSGTYSINVSGEGAGGSSNIQQAGEFIAMAGRPTALGQMSVGASGASYNVKLKVTVAGMSISCTRQLAGAI